MIQFLSSHASFVRPKRSAPCLLFGGLVLSILLSACGTNGTTTSSTANDSPQPSSVALPSNGTAAELIAKHQAVPTFEAPGPSFDARSVMKGKKILAIPVTSANPFTGAYLGSIADLSKQIGFEYKIWDNQGTHAEWQSGIQFAISQKFNLIDLAGGVQTDLLGPDIKKAQDAGIIVVDTHQSDISQGTSPNVNFTVPAPYSLAGQLMAAWATEATNRKANVLIITSSDVRGSPAFVASIKASFKNFCGDSCKYKVVDVPVAKWGSDIPPAVIGAVQSDPNLNYILPIYDPEAQFVVAALKQLGKVGKIGVASYAGVAVNYVKDGSVTMTVGEDLVSIGYAVLDAEMRGIAGETPPKSELIGTRVLTSSNIGADPKDNKALYGTDVTDGWRKLWKLTN